jgi:hypothetical protein
MVTTTTATTGGHQPWKVKPRPKPPPFTASPTNAHLGRPPRSTPLTAPPPATLIRSGVPGDRRCQPGALDRAGARPDLHRPRRHRASDRPPRRHRDPRLDLRGCPDRWAGSTSPGRTSSPQGSGRPPGPASSSPGTSATTIPHYHPTDRESGRKSDAHISAEIHHSDVAPRCLGGGSTQ